MHFGAWDGRSFVSGRKLDVRLKNARPFLFGAGRIRLALDGRNINLIYQT